VKRERNYLGTTLRPSQQQVGGFLWVLWVSSTNKTDLHDIAGILLKLALNTLNLTPNEKIDLIEQLDMTIADILLTCA
jgi:hypothetical protein